VKYETCRVVDPYDSFETASPQYEAGTSYHLTQISKERHWRRFFPCIKL